MSWMAKLYQTYEKVSAAQVDEDDNILTPVGHTQQNAHIVVVLNEEGIFQTARTMPPKTSIILPATENSENRTGKLPPPHPLADKIIYVAQDCIKYGGIKSFFDAYLKQLQQWCDSPFTHPKVRAVLRYVRQGNVVADLVKAGIFPLGSDGKILSQWTDEQDAPPIFSILPKTKGGIEFSAALVCWSVEIPGEVCSETWLDKTVWQSWVDYAAAQDVKQGFCLIQGNEAAIATKHPAKLRHTGDKAKLISSNDGEGYTFRGRFLEAVEAASISAEVSAKSHSALRWLIARQGIRNGDQVNVAWVVGGQEVPSPLCDMYCLTEKDLDEDFAKRETDEVAEPEQKTKVDWSVNFGQNAAELLKKKMYGFKVSIPEYETISLLMLDSATPGRMALSYYQEFLPIGYFDHLDAWISDFSWYQLCQHTQDKKKKYTAVLPPAPMAIAEAVYGKTLSDTLKKQLYTRLLPVIADKRPIPPDLMRQSFQTVCNRSGCGRFEWERNLGVACALYKGYRARHHESSQQKTYTMDLDTEYQSRDYLFGRLLAVAEKLEELALFLADEKRATNAERYMQKFAVRPQETWRQIELSLLPYKNRLRNNGREGFLNRRLEEIDSIQAALDVLDKAGHSLNTPLDGEFLLGYHSQRMAYRKKKSQSEKDDC